MIFESTVFVFIYILSTCVISLTSHSDLTRISTDSCVCELGVTLQSPTERKLCVYVDLEIGETVSQACSIHYPHSTVPSPHQRVSTRYNIIIMMFNVCRHLCRR